MMAAANGHMLIAAMYWAGDPEHEGLELPSGKTVHDLNADALRDELKTLNIPGFRHEYGRADLARLYALHVRQIHDMAGRRAVDRWLESKRRK